MAVAATLTLENILDLQNEIIKQGEYNERSGAGGYRVLGRMIEMRHEEAKDSNTPDREQTKNVGLVMDWKHFHNGPALGLTKDRKQLLFLSRVNPLPDLVDPNWRDTQMVQTSYGLIPARALSEEALKAQGITLQNRPMIKQRFVDHMSGTIGKFYVCRPLTQILFKIDGVQGFTTIDFTTDPYNGESAAFFLDPATGEGHIYGGDFQVAALKT